MSHDLEYRRVQVRTLESELGQSSHRARGAVPAHAYQELREQMQTRLNRIAVDRDRQATETRGLREVIAENEETIIQLQHENSWAMS